MAHLVLGLAQVAGLLLIPLSPAGIWLQLGALFLYGWWSGFQSIGGVPLVILLGLGVIAAIADVPSGRGRITADGRRRLGYAGVAGGGVGAAAGIPFPLLGSMFGALLGSAIATGVAAFTVRHEDAGYSVLSGQIVAMTLRTAAGVVIAVFTLLTLFW